MILFYLLYLELISSSQLTIFIYSFDILGSPPEGVRGTFVTVLALLARSTMDTESLPELAVNTLCPAASNAIFKGGGGNTDNAISCPTGTSSTSIAFGFKSIRKQFFRYSGFGGMIWKFQYNQKKCYFILYYYFLVYQN